MSNDKHILVEEDLFDSLKLKAVIDKTTMKALAGDILRDGLKLPKKDGQKKEA